MDSLLYFSFPTLTIAMVMEIRNVKPFTIRNSHYTTDYAPLSRVHVPVIMQNLCNLMSQSI